MKKLKYLIMLMFIFFIGIIPNISYGITKADTNAHSWGLQYPGQGFWINDSYDQFKTYFSGSGVSPDFFLNPSTRPDLYHGARPGSCTQCTEWYNQGKGFFQNIYNNAEHKIYSGSIPFVRSILEGPIDTSASSENIRRTDDLLTHMYCIEHSGGIAGEFWQIYQNVAYIHIDGNILKQASTLTKGDLYPNIYNSFNGILAYIGHATPQNGFTGNNEYGNKNYGGFGFIYSTNGTIIRSYTESQRTIWPHMNNWYREVGSKYEVRNQFSR